MPYRVHFRSGPTFRLGLLPTPPCGDAVALRYRTALGRTEADFHRPVFPPSQAHERDPPAATSTPAVALKKLGHRRTGLAAPETGALRSRHFQSPRAGLLRASGPGTRQDAGGTLLRAQIHADEDAFVAGVEEAMGQRRMGADIGPKDLRAGQRGKNFR